MTARERGDPPEPVPGGGPRALAATAAGAGALPATVGAPRVSVVLLSYNRGAWLREALESVLSQAGVALEVIVVDNLSPGSADIRRQLAGRLELTLIANEANVGFAEAMNRGIARARGAYVYLTEDDVVLREGCLRTLTAYLDTSPAAGLVAPLLLNRRDRTIRCAGGRLALSTRYPLALLGENQLDQGQYHAPFAVDFVPGSCILARTALLRRLGGFRPDFFLYFEDVDLCLRAAATGSAVVVEPRAKVDHHDPPDAPEAPLVAYHKFKNLLALQLLHAPAWTFPLFYARYGPGLALRLARAGGVQLGPWARAWRWFVRHTPRLLRERRALRRATPGGAPVRDRSAAV